MYLQNHHQNVRSWQSSMFSISKKVAYCYTVAFPSLWYLSRIVEFIRNHPRFSNSLSKVSKTEICPDFGNSSNRRSKSMKILFASILKILTYSSMHYLQFLMIFISSSKSMNMIDDSNMVTGSDTHE